MAAKKGAKAPAVRAVSTNAVDGLVGFDIETGGPFDPLGFGKNCPPEQMQWYRAAELKHGRVCMLAALGQITQHFTHWNDPSGIFDKSNSAWGAMQQVRWCSSRTICAVLKGCWMIGRRVEMRVDTPPCSTRALLSEINSSDPTLFVEMQPTISIVKCRTEPSPASPFFWCNVLAVRVCLGV